MESLSLAIVAYDTQGSVNGGVKAKRLDYTESEAKVFADFLLKHGYREIKIIPLYAANGIASASNAEGGQ